jgi:hypothetical protein
MALPGMATPRSSRQTSRCPCGQPRKREEPVAFLAHSPDPLGRDSAKLWDYRMCVSVSVIAADINYAMLTLDAVEAGELSTDDMRLLRLIPMGLRLHRAWSESSRDTVRRAVPSVTRPRVVLDLVEHLCRQAKDVGGAANGSEVNGRVDDRVERILGDSASHLAPARRQVRAEVKQGMAREQDRPRKRLRPLLIP